MLNTMSVGQLPVALNGQTHSVPSTEVPHGNISLRGLHPEDMPLVWKWYNEFPRANFDDYGPHTLEALTAEMVARMSRGEIVAIVLHDQKPVGILGFAGLTERLGTLHGICFSKEVHGIGLTHFALKNFLKILFSNAKLQKISAMYFQNNLRIKKFLRAHGFVHEGTFLQHTVCGGVPINVSVVALYRKNWEAI